MLPTKKAMTVEVGSTIVKGSSGEVRILVVEGPAERHSSTNKPIGVLIISGRDITRDLIKGTEIDLQFDMSESRDLTVSAHLTGTGQNFSQVFDPKPRTVPTKVLSSESVVLESKVQEELEDAREKGNETAARDLEKLVDEVQGLMLDASRFAEDDVTDDKFKLEDKKRRVAQTMHALTSGTFGLALPRATRRLKRPVNRSWAVDARPELTIRAP